MPRITINDPKISLPSSTGQSFMSQSGIQKETYSQGNNAIFNALANVEAQRSKAITSDYVSNSLMRSSESQLKIEQSMLANRKDIKGYADDYIREMDKLYEKEISDAPTQEAKDILKNSYSSQRISLFKDAFSKENKLLLERIKNNAEGNVNLLANRILNNPSSLPSTLEQLAAITDSVDTVLDETNKELFSKQSKDKIVGAFMTGLINQDVAAAKATLSSGQLDNHLTPDKKESFIKAIAAKEKENKKADIAAEAKMRETTELTYKIGIRNGQVTQIMLDADKETGLLDSKSYLSLSKELDKKLKQTDNIALSIADINNRINQGLPIDTSNSIVKQGLNAIFNQDIVPSLTNENAVEVINSFTDKYNFVPDNVRSNILAGLHNGSKEQVITSAKVLNTMLSENPQLADQFSSDKDIVRARTIVNSISAGMSPDEALTVANNMILQKNTAEYDQREADFRANRKDFNQGKITKFFVDDPNTVPPAMVSDFETLYRSYATDFKMPIEEAEKLAYDKIVAHWRVTEVNGDKEYMKYAPELYYKKPSSELRNILKRDIESLGENVTDYSITPIESTLDSGRPAYMVLRANENGLIVPLMSGNSILQWRPE